MGALWHPFSDMGAIESGGEFVITRGEGVRVFDDGGRSYLDATAGLWFANVGHGRTELADAAAAQLRKIATLQHVRQLHQRRHQRVGRAVGGPCPGTGLEGLPDLRGLGLDRYRRQDRPSLLGRAWRAESHDHDRQAEGVSRDALRGHLARWAGTQHRRLRGPGPGDRARRLGRCGRTCARAIERLGPDNVAGFFCEPVLGAGGVYPPPVGYLEAARKICADYEVLFVADEVITGYGRIGGAWFASTRFGLDPDMVISAKGLSSGYAPVGAVLVAPAVAEPFFRPGAGVWFRHGYTYSGHAMCAAVALANLELIEREGLLRGGRPAGDHPRADAVPVGRARRGARGALRHRCAGGRAAGGPGGCADAGGAAAGGGGRDARGRRGRHPDLTGVRDDRCRGRRAGCGHRAGGRPALTVSTAAAHAPRQARPVSLPVCCSRRPSPRC